MKVLFQLVLLVSVVGTLAGCGTASASPKPESPLAPVKGIVTLDGKPLEGATIIFAPQGAKMGDGAIGVTDATGLYEATCGGATGAPIGSYKITISRLVDPSGKPVVATLDSPPANVGARESMPPKFSDHAMTALKCTVAAGGGTFDFKLSSR